MPTSGNENTLKWGLWVLKWGRWDLNPVPSRDITSNFLPFFIVYALFRDKPKNKRANITI